MAITTDRPTLFCGGAALDPAHIAELRPSTDALDAPEELRRRMATDGYLYLPGLLMRDDVLAARRTILQRLAAEGLIKPGTDPMDAILSPGQHIAFRPDLANDNPQLDRALYSGPLMGFFESFLGGPVLHFTYTWLRVMPPGNGTPCHVDSVYMNRGTHELFTAWIPLGDVDYTLGGLMVLQGSNNNQRLKQTYGMQDVDSFCTNKPLARKWGKSWGTGGWLMGKPEQIRRSCGGPDARWLTTEYRTGDVLIFSIFTIHASLDNRSADRIRLSSDSRYQLANQPADERWIGSNPVGHGPAGKRGKIC